ncbi:MAG TPA: hypothetical protein VFU36_15195, partial [Jatrophihabitans sp.]|nr:hypothetical protein [Jatrophihabitans sp.]
QALAGTDGLIGIVEALPDDPAWQHGELLPAAHHRLPGNPSAIRQILTACAQWSAGAGAGESVVLLLAPPLAGDDAWDALLAAAGIGDVQRADLRQPGLTPDQVDLGGLQPSSHYVVRLADDGSLSLPAAVDQLDLVMRRIQLLNPSASFILVGHSVCGAVAAGWAAGNVALVRGLVTLGAPLFGSGLAPVADGEPATGIRLAQALTPDGLDPAPVLGDALALAGDALSGGVPLAGFNRLPGDLTALAGRPLLALAGTLDGELVPALGAAIASELRSAGQRDPVSHLGFGVRMGLQLPAGPVGELSVRASVRLDLGRLPLLVGAPEPAMPASQLVVEVNVTGPDGGWLLGGPTVEPGAPRLRRAQFQVAVAAGGLAGAGIRLHDLAVDGSSALVVDPDHPLAAAGLAALAGRLHDGRGKGGPVGALVAVLEGVGLLSSDGTVRPDVLAAVAADPVGQLGPVLPGLLDAGLGFGVLAAHGTAAGLGPWRLAHPRLPVELMVQARPWRIAVQTTGDGLPTAGGGRLVGSGTLALADLQPSVHVSQSFYGLSVQRDPVTGQVQLTSPWLTAPVTLLPPDGPALQAALLPLLGRLLADAAITALVQALAGDGDPIRSLSGLAIDPAGWLLTTFGNGTLPDPAAIDALLRAVADAAGLPSDAGRPLILPGGIGLTVAPAGTGLRLGLSLPKTQLGSSPQPAGDPALALDLGLT